GCKNKGFRGRLGSLGTLLAVTVTWRHFFDEFRGDSCDRRPAIRIELIQQLLALPRWAEVGKRQIHAHRLIYEALHRRVLWSAHQLGIRHQGLRILIELGSRCCWRGRRSGIVVGSSIVFVSALSRASNQYHAAGRHESCHLKSFAFYYHHTSTIRPICSSQQLSSNVCQTAPPRIARRRRPTQRRRPK